MKVAVYYNNKDIRIEERPIPKIGDNEILVKMMASGICGTDLLEWYRIKKAPVVLGHEMAGVIEETGKSIKQYKKGDRVFVSHHVPCHRCHFCKERKFTACEYLHKGNYDPGGFSEYIRVPERNVKYGTFILPENITFEEATLIEPLACVISAQKKLRIKKGHSLLVIGSGVSGLLHIRLAKLKGAKIFAVDKNKFKLENALSSGADHVFLTDEYSIEKVKSLNNSREIEIIIICTSSESAVDMAFSSIERHGQILFFAVPEKNIILDSIPFWRNEISLFFSYGASSIEIKKSISMIKNNKVKVKDLVTHSMPLSKISEAFRIAIEGQNSLKVILKPDELKI